MIFVCMMLYTARTCWAIKTEEFNNSLDQAGISYRNLHKIPYGNDMSRYGQLIGAVASLKLAAILADQNMLDEAIDYLRGVEENVAQDPQDGQFIESMTRKTREFLNLPEPPTAFKREARETLRANLPYLLTEKATYHNCLSLASSLTSKELYPKECSKEFPGIKIPEGNSAGFDRDLVCDMNYKLAWIGGLYGSRESICRSDYSLSIIEHELNKIECGTDLAEINARAQERTLNKLRDSFNNGFDEDLHQAVEGIILAVENYLYRKIDDRSEALEHIHHIVEEQKVRGYYHRYVFQYIERLAICKI